MLKREEEGVGMDALMDTSVMTVLEICRIAGKFEWVFLILMTILNVFFDTTRKYLLCGYVLNLLMHTTAWDQH